ncbi:MAG: S8 family serine peptidase, partial [FCB group bacterium]|nr:S8 family serine peptidase [FCB group bacterium]
MKKSLKTLVGLILVIVLFTASEYAGGEAVPYPCENDLIEVMFAPDSKVRLRGGEPVDLTRRAMIGVEEILQPAGEALWSRHCDLSEERLDELHALGEARSGETLYNLNNIYRVKIGSGQDIWQISKELEALPGIIHARPVPKPMPLPIPPDYESTQGYLDPAVSVPSGISAEYVWNLFGGVGGGVTVCDLEYGWNYAHADITMLPGSQINPYTIYIPSGMDDRHGTAVVGEMVSDSNGWGTTGICFGALLKTCGTYYDDPLYGYTVWNVPGAITIAASALSPGDVILIEHQWDYYGGNTFVPIEWWTDSSPNPQTFNPCYAAITNAIALGINVVEAGGNGNVNTDGMAWYGNSGAIIVGAGGAAPGPNSDRQRLSFSSYGSRFNLQGWGENVVTAGDTGTIPLYKAEGKNYWYTNSFSGTSSASPIVAGAAACCVGYWTGLGWPATLLTPNLLRNTLITTGTPQDFSVAGNIGPRPNLRAACSVLVRQQIEWQDITPPEIANNGGRTIGVAWGDFDDDGDEDVYLTCNGPNKLVRNEGGGVFLDLTNPPLGDASLSKGAAWGDYDNDGDLDLYLCNEGVSNKLFRNNGMALFSDVTTSPLDDAGMSQHGIWGDYDNDGDIDLYVVNYASANKLLRNDGGGSFTDVSAAPLNDAGSGGGAAWGDYDNDGDLDLYLVNFYSEPNRLYRNDGGGSFTDVTVSPLDDANEGVACAWGDYDNDGFLDLFLTNNGQANKLFDNTAGTFADVTSGVLGDTSYNFGCAWGDYDNDGDLDLMTTTSYCCNKLLRNDGLGAFTEATSGFLFQENEFSMGAAWA